VPFTYKGKTYDPKPLQVSPLLLRGYTCPPGCGGCCFKFTLDYLPTENSKGLFNMEKRVVDFDGRKVIVWTDSQADNETSRCRHLLTNGRCGIHGRHPFTCDFELIRTLAFESQTRPHILTAKLFGRGWSYPRTDGGKGAKCEMLGVTDDSIKEVERKLKRLKNWTDHFGIKKTWIPDILGLLHPFRLDQPVLLDPKEKEGFGY
jgi:hypothetical protein